MKKISKITRELGFAYLFEAIFMYPLQRICNIYNDQILEKKYPKQKEVIKNLHNYQMILKPKKKALHRDLLIHNTREPEATAFLQNKLKKGDIVLEAGANIGYYALLSSKKIGNKGFVYCVEPSSENYELLERNIKLNKSKNIELKKMALGKENGEGSLNLFEEGNLNTLKENTNSKLKGVEKVKIMTVDDFLENRQKPDIIRMDVEGSEYDIMKGAKKLLENNPPRLIFMEFHGFYMGLKRSKELLKNLSDKEYEIAFFSLEKNVPYNIPFVSEFMEKIFKRRNKRIMKTKKMTIKKLIANDNLLNNYSPGIFFEYIGKKKEI